MTDPHGAVQIAHGVAEHGSRYDRLAQALNAAGFLVFANDHRGHGRSVVSEDDLGNFGFAGFPGLVADVAAYGAPSPPSTRTCRSSWSRIPWAPSQHSRCCSTIGSSTPGWCCPAPRHSTSWPASIAESGEPVGLEAFNAGFEHRTGYEWLSRDESEVDAYVADPLCGFDVPDEAIPQMFADAQRLADPDVLAGIRSDLPILIVSGQADPLAGGGQLVELLGQRYRDAGLTDVTTRVYPEARHEIFNETNRDEITADVVAWLRAHS